VIGTVGPRLAGGAERILDSWTTADRFCWCPHSSARCMQPSHCWFSKMATQPLTLSNLEICRTTCRFALALDLREGQFEWSVR
jgi:hypothetical protein